MNKSKRLYIRTFGWRMVERLQDGVMLPQRAFSGWGVS